MERQVQNIQAASQMGAITSITQQPGLPQRIEIKSAVKYLATFQLVIGLLTVCFGFAVFFEGSMLQFVVVHGIVAGVLICVAGCLGILSLQDRKNRCKNGVHMGFSIVACCVSVIGIFLHFRFTLFYLKERAGTFKFLLFVLSMVEFVTALVISLFTCQFACESGCCSQYQKGQVPIVLGQVFICISLSTVLAHIFANLIGVVMYHGNQPYIVMNTNENTMMMAAYPPTSHPQNFSLAKNYQNQVVSTMPFNKMSANVTQTPEEASQGSTSATYSNQEPPTSLSRKGGSC